MTTIIVEHNGEQVVVIGNLKYLDDTDFDSGGFGLYAYNCTVDGNLIIKE